MKKLKEIWNNVDLKKDNTMKENTLQTPPKKIINYTSNKKSLIDVKNLGMSYKTKNKVNTIFSNINFKIYENEIIALLGPNGAGKTTIVEIITKIKKQTNGEVVYNYETKDGEEDVGVQFQDLSFPKGLTVKDFIDFQIMLSNKNIDENFLSKLLKTFKMDQLLNMKVSKLSGGQQQRLNVLIAMMSNPRVLFLDEFTTGLDIAIKNEIKEFILQYSKEHNVTIILISHDIDIIDQMANRFLLISNKELVIDTSKENIIKEFGSVSKFLFNYIK